MFEVGDVVVCVETDGATGPHWCPQLREVYRLTRFGEAVDQNNGSDAIAVGLAQDPRGRDYGWPAEWFRKIAAADESFTAEMRALRPQQVDA